MIVLIVSLPCGLRAETCMPENGLVIIAPPSGTKTASSNITVRGFLCMDAGQVLVINNTTTQTTVAETNPTCDEDSCIYTFAAFVEDLAPGINDLTATTAGRTAETTIQVIRTALVLN